MTAAAAGLLLTIIPVKHARPHIGVLREKPLHASLKQWYAEDGDRLEVPVEGFVIDLVRDRLLIEVQTRGFSGMKEKLASLLDQGHRIRIVHPIPIDKWIVKVDSDGTILSRRRSPKHGTVIDVFAELVSFPKQMTHSSLEVEVLLINEEEYRVHTPDRSWRRKGWSVMERRLIDVVDAVLFRTANDLARLIPDQLPDPFTTADLAKAVDRPRRTAQRMAYCLRLVGAIDEVGRRGNTILYRRG